MEEDQRLETIQAYGEQVANAVVRVIIEEEPPATMEEAADRLATLAAVVTALVEKAAFITGSMAYGQPEQLEKYRNMDIRVITEAINSGFNSAIKIGMNLQRAKEEEEAKAKEDKA